MKQFLLLFFSMICMNGLFAQSVLIISNTDTVCVNGGIDELDIVAHTYVVNNTNQRMNLRWELNNMAQPGGWETAVCDNNACYPPFVLTNIVEGGNPDAPVDLMPGDTSIIDMHIYPDGNRGTGYTQVCFSTKENPDEGLGCMTYKFSVGRSSSVEDQPTSVMEIFPNPTVDYFGLTHSNSIEEIHVYNMLGRKQRTFDVGQGRKYFVGDMPAGMYLLAFIDKKGKVTKTTRLVKRFFRP